eukprot:Hpha_TRINITY_DN31241_c0_g1::TRINITY_DN31241_c0_g1_i1::g.2358::m.2358
MGSPRLVLCTDLDGTFLGDPGRQQLYDAIRKHRDKLTLIYATGRSLHSIADHLGWEGHKGDCPPPDPPPPDYIIADVGTKVYSGSPTEGWKPVAEVQDWIQECWGDSGPRVMQILRGIPGLELQGGGTGWESPSGHNACAANRVSYYFDTTCDVDGVCAKLREAGFEAVASHGRYLDVLPPGVGKGHTLLRLLDSIKADVGLVVAAGDTYNDITLFEVCTERGPRGVVVGNGEKELIAAVKGRPGVFMAQHHGAAGIWEGLLHFGHDWISG